jgi:hypothetical protein
MKGIGRRWRKAMALIEGAGALILGVDDDRANAGDVGSSKRPQHGVAKQSGSDPLALPVQGDCQSGQHHYGNRITPKPFPQTVGGILESDLSDNKRVVTNDVFTGTGDIGLSGPGLLVRPCVVDQIAIERVLTAIECFDCLPTLQLFKHKLAHGYLRPGENVGTRQKSLQRRVVGRRRIEGGDKCVPLVSTQHKCAPIG